MSQTLMQICIKPRSFLHTKIEQRRWTQSGGVESRWATKPKMRGSVLET